MYFSIVYSTVTYCITVWGGIFCCTHRGEELQMLQKAIVKNLFYEFSDPDACIFKTNRILKLDDIYRLYVSIYIYKVIKLDVHPVLLNDLELTINNHVYNTRNRNNFVQPFPRVENIRMNFKYMFPTIWNSIPTEVKDAESLSIFKKRSTCHFLSKY